MSISINPLAILAALFRPLFRAGVHVSEWVLDLIVARSYPQSGGQLALSGRPDGAMLGALYDLWSGKAMRGAIVIGMINYIGLWVAEIATSSGKIKAEVQQARAAAPKKLIMIPFSWVFGAVVLFVASSVISFAMPESAQMAPNMAAMYGNISGAGWAFILVWFFGGLFMIAIAVSFLLTWLFLYILLPCLPILFAMSILDFWMFKQLSDAFGDLISKFVSAAFYPLPTALVIMAGYPILNMMQGSLPGPAQWVGVPVYGICVVLLWFLALIAPLYVFWAKSVSPATILGAGVLGGLSLAGLRNGAGGMSGRAGLSGVGAGAGGGGGGSGSGGGAAAGASTSTNAMAGSPFGSSASSIGSGSTDANTAAMSGSDSSPSQAVGTGSGPGIGTGTAPGLDTTVGGAVGESGSGSSTSTTTGTSAADSGSDNGAQWGARTDPISVSDPDVTVAGSPDDLPNHQSYHTGYFSEWQGDDAFKPVFPGTRDADFYPSKQFERVDQVHDDKDLLAHGKDDDVYYDVSSFAGAGESARGQSFHEEHMESRSTVSDARTGTDTTTN